MNLVLESERLQLRPQAPADSHVEIEIGTDPAAMKYVGRVETPDQIVRNMRNYVKRCAGGSIGIWCVTARATNEKLGTAILLPLPIEAGNTDWALVTGDDIPDGEIEVGYMLKKSVWGRGYATEACRRMLQFAFEETALPEVVAITHPDNAASRRVLEKSGMLFEGMRRAYAADCPGFRITREQWAARRA